MATATAPAGSSLLGKLGAAVAGRRAARSRRASRLAALAVKAREHVVTAAALGSVDLGAFHWGAGVGWITVGASLLSLDFAVRG